MKLRRVVDRTAARNPLPEGTWSVGAGLLVGGVTAYGYLAISGRVLGPERYASLSALWFLAFLAGPGFFLPLEQEVGRAVAARRALGTGGAPVIRRAALAGGLLALGLVVVTLATSQLLLDHLFDDDALLLLAFAFLLVGYFLVHLLKGTLSGNGRFGSYGMLLGAEGFFRMAGCVALAVAGVERAGAFGLLIGLAPFAAIVVPLVRERGLLIPGPEAPWSELSVSLGYLLVGAVLAQGLVNAAPLAAKILATPGEQEAAGKFIAGVVIARIPVFLFQAVQAALLPKLAGLASAGKHGDFRHGLKRVLAAMSVLGLVATLVALVIGPWALRVLFGAEFELGHRDLGFLAAASSIYMLALALAQALIALSAHQRVAVSWFLSIVIFVVVTALGSDLLFRVELAYLVASAAGALTLAAFLVRRMSQLPVEEPPLGVVIAPEYVEP